MKNDVAVCGLNCTHCDAYLATVNDDLALREKTAQKWSEMNQTRILPEQIACEGCRTNGIKNLYCLELCEIRQCARKKCYASCGECAEMEDCRTVDIILRHHPEARDNLRSAGNEETKAK